MMLALAAAVALECSTYWTVRLVFEYQPNTWATMEMTPYTPDKATAITWRQDVLKNGWVWPNLFAETESEVRVAPGAIKFASIKQLCCSQPPPPGDGLVCTYPGHYPPPAP